MELFELADAPGPAKVAHVWEPRLGLGAVVVIDDVACGPGGAAALTRWGRSGRATRRTASWSRSRIARAVRASASRAARERYGGRSC